jgi:tetratricopeptide (TPR) repeat protein
MNPARPRQEGRLTALLLPLLALGTGGSACAEPFVPKGDDVVIEHIAGAGDRATQAARGLRALLARAPDQIDLALKVAQDEIALGRAEGDPRHYGRAEAALAPWIHEPDPPAPVLLLRATLLQNRHDFDAALADLDSLIASNPKNAQARLIRATVRQVKGDYAGAAGDCRSLDGLAQPAIAATCLAAIDGVTGRAAEALVALREAGAILASDNQPELLLWSLTLQGEIAARAGRPDESESSFRRALALGRRDVYLLGAYADFLLDQDRPAEIVALLRDETRVDPLLLRLAIAERRLGLKEAEAHIRDLAARFDTARRRGDTIHRREEARFELELMRDPDTALALAVANWSVQREPADARILLEAAGAAGKPGAAASALAWLHDAGFQDVHIAAMTRPSSQAGD